MTASRSQNVIRSVHRYPPGQDVPRGSLVTFGGWAHTIIRAAGASGSTIVCSVRGSRSSSRRVVCDRVAAKALPAVQAGNLRSAAFGFDADGPDPKYDVTP